jgi:hypothetical protein
MDEAGVSWGHSEKAGRFGLLLLVPAEFQELALVMWNMCRSLKKSPAWTGHWSKCGCAYFVNHILTFELKHRKPGTFPSWLPESL